MHNSSLNPFENRRFVPQHYQKAVALQCQLFFEGRDVENIDSRAASVGLRSLRNLEQTKV